MAARGLLQRAADAAQKAHIFMSSPAQAAVDEPLAATPPVEALSDTRRAFINRPSPTPITSTTADLGTSYLLCIYSGGAHVWTAHARAGGLCNGLKPCWKDLKTGFKLGNKPPTPDGVAASN